MGFRRRSAHGKNAERAAPFHYRAGARPPKRLKPRVPNLPMRATHPAATIPPVRQSKAWRRAMSQDASRKTKLLDLMVLLASTAVGLALARYYLMTPWSYTPTVSAEGTLTMVPDGRYSALATGSGAVKSLAR